MMATPRYALYFSPPTDSRLWHAGSSWLGRDAANDKPVMPPLLANIRTNTLLAITQHPRRYGFHATLKAPFHLAQDTDRNALLLEVEKFAKGQASFALPKLKVDALQDFLALVPSGPTHRISAMERRCVAHFDRYRRQLTDAQLVKRRKKSLTTLENEMLIRWGYPHSFERFRFHLTLTDSLRGTHERFADRIRRAAEEIFAGDVIDRCAFDAVSVFEESTPDADFRLILRAPFGRQGRLIYVIGPSGAGKDSVLRWAQDRLLLQSDIQFARRVITRPQADSSEQHEQMSAATFSALERRRGLAMVWEAHGLRYGIRRDIDVALSRGMTVLINGSRAHLPIAMAAYPHLEVVHITAPDAIIEQRLRSRGRENAAQIAVRRSRPAPPIGKSVAMTEIANDGMLRDAGRKLLEYITCQSH